MAHWCATEARFRNHLKKIKKDDAEKLIPLENMLVRITQQDVVYRRYLVRDHRSYVPGLWRLHQGAGAEGRVEYRSLSRQLVLFCVERRKAWRMLQSKAGIENKEYKAQRSILADVDAGKISKEELFARGDELLRERVEGAGAAASTAHAPRADQPPPAAAAPPAPAVDARLRTAKRRDRRHRPRPDARVGHRRRTAYNAAGCERLSLPLLSLRR